MQINLHKINWIRVSVILLLLVSLCLNFVQCENSKTAYATIEAQNSEISTYKLKNGQLVSSKQTAILTEKQLKNQIVSKDKELQELTKKFSEVKTVTKIVTRTVVDTINIPYEVPVNFEFERTGEKTGKDYSVNYFSNQNGVVLDSLIIKGNLDFVSGTKRKWFWGKETHTFDVTTKSDFIKFDTIQHYEVQNPKKWYQTDGAKMGGAIIIFEVAKALLTK